MTKEVTGTIILPKEGMSWKAFAQIAILIAMLTIGAVYGVTYRVTIGTPEVLTALNMQVGSTYSLISKDYSYVIACPLGNTSLFCLQNGTTGALDSYRTNKTLIQTYAIGNLTAGGGSIFIKALEWNTSVSIPSGVIVVESYSGVFTYRTATMSQHIPACPTSVNNTFTLTSDTSEHTIVTLTPTGVEQVTNFYLDLSELTQNCTLRVYLKIDGVNYVELTGMTVTVAAGSKGMPLKDHVIDTDWKVTIQSVIAEGASRDVDYRYFVNVY